MGMGDNIVVNDFMFCLDHGHELCHICFCDHRMCNNIRIEDEPGISALSDELDFDMEERTPRNAYRLGAIIDKGPENCKCRKHNKVDCGSCFNWVKMIKEEAGVKE